MQVSRRWGAAPRQRRSIAEKQRIVEETLVEGASVALAHCINANLVFGWRRLYLAGRLGECKPGHTCITRVAIMCTPTSLVLKFVNTMTYN